MTLVDSHCHLDDEKFDADRAAVISRARAAGVATLVAVGTGDGPPDLEAGIRLAESGEGIVATVGVHPHAASKVDDAVLDRVRALTSHPKVVWLGEIGLDYHYDFAPRETQERVFIDQMNIAGTARLPIVIHTREAWDDTFRLLEQYWAPTGLPCILHCFTGGPAEAERALALGFYLSFGGIVTYPKAAEVHAAARLTPPDRLLIETDSPYLAPVPHRGKRNEPAFVAEVARRLAELRSETLENVAQVTTENVTRLLALASAKIDRR